MEEVAAYLVPHQMAASEQAAQAAQPVHQAGIFITPFAAFIFFDVYG